MDREPAAGQKFTESGKSLWRTEEPVSIADVQVLAWKSQKQMVEYGVSVYMTSSGKTDSVFTKGGEGSIFEPEPPSDLRGKIKSGVFIHCHPIRAEDRVTEEERSLHILPSGNTALPGDFEASSRVIGGYLNIASEYGLTMFIGIEGITRDEKILRDLRRKVGEKRLGKQKVWKIFSGGKAGTALVDYELEEAVVDKFSLSEDVVLLSNTEEAGVRYFLHVSWTKLKELESAYGDLSNLCFGDGLDKLIQTLDLRVPHEANLGRAAGIIYKTPKKREGS